MGVIALNKYRIQIDETDNEDKSINRQVSKALRHNQTLEVTNATSTRFGLNNKKGLKKERMQGDQVTHQGNSTAIQAFKYNPKTEDLDVVFRSSPKKYTFPDVPTETVEQWLEEPSKGKGYHKLIKPYSVA